MEAILPAWFVPRMATDSWCFGLRLTTGDVMVIEHITNVVQAKDGSIWIDVLMSPYVDKLPDQATTKYLFAPTSRCEASVNTAHIICAFKLADT
jgi:hypothetical protein